MLAYYIFNILAIGFHGTGNQIFNQRYTATAAGTGFGAFFYAVNGCTCRHR